MNKKKTVIISSIVGILILYYILTYFLGAYSIEESHVAFYKSLYDHNKKTFPKVKQEPWAIIEQQHRDLLSSKTYYCILPGVIYVIDDPKSKAGENAFYFWYIFGNKKIYVKTKWIE